MGISTRTSFPLTNPPFSAIRYHSEDSDHRFTYTDFRILSTSSNRADLLTLESLYIDKMKLSLNRNTAVQLFHTIINISFTREWWSPYLHFNPAIFIFDNHSFVLTAVLIHSNFRQFSSHIYSLSFIMKHCSFSLCFQVIVVLYAIS